MLEFPSRPSDRIGNVFIPISEALLQDDDPHAKNAIFRDVEAALEFFTEGVLPFPAAMRVIPVDYGNWQKYYADGGLHIPVVEIWDEEGALTDERDTRKAR